MNNIKTILLCLIFAAASLVLCLGANAYNKSWDQGHQSTNPDEGESGWGNEDYEGFFEGKYTPKPCSKMCPVFAKTGELQKTYTDLSVSGTGPTLEITRTYLSQTWASSLLGNRWVFNFGKRMIITKNKDDEKVIGVIQDTGQKNFFREFEDGSLKLLAGY